jgi:large subunit ribosomal protein L1
VPNAHPEIVRWAAFDGALDEQKLADNITAFVDQIRAVKPTGVKGNYIRSITVAGTMTPGVPVTM